MLVCITALYTVAVLCAHVCHTRHVCYCPGGEGGVGLCGGKGCVSGRCGSDFDVSLHMYHNWPLT